MTAEEFSDQFDVLYNNITSNQAAGLTEYEKCVFLTKAQTEVVKNYFTANSKGNTIGQGFDDSAKRQADFSCLMMTSDCTPIPVSSLPAGYKAIDSRSSTYKFPSDVFIVINESIKLSNPEGRILQVIPLRYDDYTAKMSKPYKRPNKYQAWRLLNQGAYTGSTTNRYAEIIVGPSETINTYSIRYIKFPKPIIIGDLDDLSLEGYTYGTGTMQTIGCELDPILHQDILQRAVELAKVAWTSTGQDNIQPVLAAGERVE